METSQEESSLTVATARVALLITSRKRDWGLESLNFTSKPRTWDMKRLGPPITVRQKRFWPIELRPSSV